MIVELVGVGQAKIPIMNSKPPYYRIYLLTVWQERSRGPPTAITWRFRLEDPRTGWQQAFADVATFLAVLRAITSQPEQGAQPAGDKE